SLTSSSSLDSDSGLLTTVLDMPVNGSDTSGWLGNVLKGVADCSCGCTGSVTCREPNGIVTLATSTGSVPLNGGADVNLGVRNGNLLLVQTEGEVAFAVAPASTVQLSLQVNRNAVKFDCKTGKFASGTLTLSPSLTGTVEMTITGRASGSVKYG